MAIPPGGAYDPTAGTRDPLSKARHAGRIEPAPPENGGLDIDLGGTAVPTRSPVTPVDIATARANAAQQEDFHNRRQQETLQGYSFDPTSRYYVGNYKGTYADQNGRLMTNAEQQTRLAQRGLAAQGRAGPQANFLPAAAAFAGQNRQIGASDLTGLRQSNLAAALEAQAAGTAGPSVAEMAMRRGSDAAMRQQLALAAGGAGPSSAGALINAQNQNALAQGALVRDTGIQRAAEQQAARAQLADVLGTQRAQYLAAAGVYGQTGTTLGGMALDQARIDQGANAQNDALEQFYAGLGQSAAEAEANRMTTYGTSLMGVNASRYAAKKGADAAGADPFLGLAGPALTAGGAVLGTILAPGPGTVAGGAAGSAAGQAVNSQTQASDIRAKTNIVPAGQHLDDTFRGIGGYGYDYTDPSHGVGRHYGPMAQELEQTPAGQSTVTRMPGGTKGVDTGRLALITASETANLRKELDAIKGQGKAIRDTRVEYPRLAVNGYGAEEPGNIDLTRRPHVRNADGSISTVRSMGVNIDGHETLIPTVSEDGRIMQDEEAIDAYRRGGKHLGKFRSVRDSNEAARAIHEDQARNMPGDTLVARTAALAAANDRRQKDIDLFYEADARPKIPISELTGGRAMTSRSPAEFAYGF